MPNPRKRLTGKTYGLLTVVSPAKPDRHGNTQWNCLCACGRETVVRYQHLSTNTVRSCGKEGCRGRGADPFVEEAFWGTTGV